MNRLEVQARVIPTAGWPMVLGQRTDTPGGRTVLLYGHYDVQPPEPLEDWLSPPFEPTIRNGCLCARGVGDNKGQHFAQLLALEALLACRGALPCNVKVRLEGEEEIGSPQMAPCKAYIGRSPAVTDARLRAIATTFLDHMADEPGRPDQRQTSQVP